MKKQLVFGLLSILLIVVIVLAGCGPKTTTTTTSQTTTTAPLKTLKFGALLNLSNAQYLQAQKWYNLYAKLINDKGGWKIGNDTYRLEFVIYDMQSGAAAAKDALSRLVLQDGVKFVFGGTGASAVDATVTEPNHVIVVGNDMTNDAAKPEIKYYYTTGNFFASALVYKVCKDMVDTGVKTYVSVKPDTQLGHFMDSQIDAAWNIASGGSVTKLDTVWVDPSMVDFGPVATKIMSKNPDCADLIYVGMIPNSVPQIYKALADVGFTGTILPGIASVNDVKNLAVTVGKEIIEGGEVFSQDPTGYQDDPRMLSFLDAYVKEYGQMEYDNTSALAAVLLIEDAINATKSVDSDVVKAYLDKMDHAVRNPTGWTGIYARPDLGNLRTICGGNSHPVSRITDGVLKNFSKVTLKEQYLFAIMSNNMMNPTMIDTYKAYWNEYGYPNFPAEEEANSTIHFSDFGITGID